jgi:hypothetical protein
MKVFAACLLGVLWLATGCCSTSPSHPAGSSAATHRTACTNNVAVWHSVIIEPPPGAKPVRWYNRINVIWWFGNREEPTPPDWYCPSNALRTPMWYLRNPMKNFTWYVIGIADKKTVRSGKYPELITKPKGGWNFAMSSYKWIHLPYISYSYKSFVTYFGWRERGDFGMAFRFNNPPPKKKPDKPDSNSPEPDVGTAAPNKN